MDDIDSLETNYAEELQETYDTNMALDMESAYNLLTSELNEIFKTTVGEKHYILYMFLRNHKPKYIIIKTDIAETLYSIIPEYVLELSSEHLNLLLNDPNEYFKNADTPKNSLTETDLTKISETLKSFQKDPSELLEHIKNNAIIDVINEYGTYIIQIKQQEVKNDTLDIQIKQQEAKDDLLDIQDETRYSLKDCIRESHGKKYAPNMADIVETEDISIDTFNYENNHASTKNEHINRAIKIPIDEVNDFTTFNLKYEQNGDQICFPVSVLKLSESEDHKSTFYMLNIGHIDRDSLNGFSEIVNIPLLNNFIKNGYPLVRVSISENDTEITLKIEIIVYYNIENHSINVSDGVLKDKYLLCTYTRTDEKEFPVKIQAVTETKTSDEITFEVQTDISNAHLRTILKTYDNTKQNIYNNSMFASCYNIYSAYKNKSSVKTPVKTKVLNALSETFSKDSSENVMNKSFYDLISEKHYEGFRMKALINLLDTSCKNKQLVIPHISTKQYIVPYLETITFGYATFVEWIITNRYVKEHDEFKWVSEETYNDITEKNQYGYFQLKSCIDDVMRELFPELFCAKQHLLKKYKWNGRTHISFQKRYFMYNSQEINNKTMLNIIKLFFEKHDTGCPLDTYYPIFVNLKHTINETFTHTPVGTKNKAYLLKPDTINTLTLEDYKLLFNDAFVKNNSRKATYTKEEIKSMYGKLVSKYPVKRFLGGTLLESTKDKYVFSDKAFKDSCIPVLSEGITVEWNVHPIMIQAKDFIQDYLDFNKPSDDTPDANRSPEWIKYNRNYITRIAETLLNPGYNENYPESPENLSQKSVLMYSIVYMINRIMKEGEHSQIDFKRISENLYNSYGLTIFGNRFVPEYRLHEFDTRKIDIAINKLTKSNSGNEESLERAYRNKDIKELIDKLRSIIPSEGYNPIQLLFNVRSKLKYIKSISGLKESIGIELRKHNNNILRTALNILEREYIIKRFSRELLKGFDVIFQLTDFMFALTRINSQNIHEIIRRYVKRTDDAMTAGTGIKDNTCKHLITFSNIMKIDRNAKKKPVICNIIDYYSKGFSAKSIMRTIFNIPANVVNFNDFASCVSEDRKEELRRSIRLFRDGPPENIDELINLHALITLICPDRLKMNLLRDNNKYDNSVYTSSYGFPENIDMNKVFIYYAILDFTFAYLHKRYTEQDISKSEYMKQLDNIIQGYNLTKELADAYPNIIKDIIETNSRIENYGEIKLAYNGFEKTSERTGEKITCYGFKDCVKKCYEKDIKSKDESGRIDAGIDSFTVNTTVMTMDRYNSIYAKIEYGSNKNIFVIQPIMLGIFGYTSFQKFITGVSEKILFTNDVVIKGISKKDGMQDYFKDSLVDVVFGLDNICKTKEKMHAEYKDQYDLLQLAKTKAYLECIGNVEGVVIEDVFNKDPKNNLVYSVWDLDRTEDYNKEEFPELRFTITHGITGFIKDRTVPEKIFNEIKSLCTVNLNSDVLVKNFNRMNALRDELKSKNDESERILNEVSGINNEVNTLIQFVLENEELKETKLYECYNKIQDVIGMRLDQLDFNDTQSEKFKFGTTVHITEFMKNISSVITEADSVKHIISLDSEELNIRKQVLLNILNDKTVEVVSVEYTEEQIAEILSGEDVNKIMLVCSSPKMYTQVSSFIKSNSNHQERILGIIETYLSKVNKNAPNLFKSILRDAHSAILGSTTVGRLNKKDIKAVQNTIRTKINWIDSQLKNVVVYRKFNNEGSLTDQITQIHTKMNELKNKAEDYTKLQKENVEINNEIRIIEQNNNEFQNTLDKFTYSTVYDSILKCNYEDTSNITSIIKAFINELNNQFDKMIGHAETAFKCFILCSNMTEVEFTNSFTKLYHDVYYDICNKISSNAFMKAIGYKCNISEDVIKYDSCIPLHRYNTIKLFDIIKFRNIISNRTSLNSLQGMFVFRCMEQVIYTMVRLYTTFIKQTIYKHDIAEIYDGFENIPPGSMDNGAVHIMICKDDPSTPLENVCYVKDMSAVEVINQLLYNFSTIHKFLYTSINNRIPTFMNNFRIIKYITPSGEITLNKGLLNALNVYPIEMSDTELSLELLTEQVKVIENNMLKSYRDYSSILEGMGKTNEYDIIMRLLKEYNIECNPEEFIKGIMQAACGKYEYVCKDSNYINHSYKANDGTSTDSTIFRNAFVYNPNFANLYDSDYKELYPYMNIMRIARNEYENTSSIKTNNPSSVLSTVDVSRCIYERSSEKQMKDSIEVYGRLKGEQQNEFLKQLVYMITGTQTIVDSIPKDVYINYIRNSYLYNTGYNISGDLIADTIGTNTLILYSENMNASSIMIQKHGLYENINIESEYIFSPYVPNILSMQVIEFQKAGKCEIVDPDEISEDENLETDMDGDMFEESVSENSDPEEIPKTVVRTSVSRFNVPDSSMSSDTEEDIVVSVNRSIGGGARMSLLKQIILYVSLFLLIILLIVLLVKIIKEITVQTGTIKNKYN